MNKIEFRGKKTDGTWVYGDLYQGEMDGKTFKAIITRNETKIWPKGSLPENTAVLFFTDEFHYVYSGTVGQLRYENEHGKYFDGDVYYVAGYGNDFVSDFCLIHACVIHGENNNIGRIIGNIFDNPELLNEKP